MRVILLVFAALLFPSFAWAQSHPGPVSATSVITPNGTSAFVTLGQLASQQGVLVDSFHQAGDADDTPSFTRAVAAGVPILCGPRTYTVNNFSTGAVTNFVLKGIKGCVIQRTSASGSQFFQISAANVVIDGVAFDMNKASVTANQWGVFLGAGGQTIDIRNSTFKNNSGSLGSCLTIQSTGPSAGGSFSISNSEITGCTFNPLYLASVSRGVVYGDYIHDNSTSGAYVLANGTASSTNYSTNIDFIGNRFISNTGAGLAIGSFAAPYTYGTSSAQWIGVVGNTFLDNGAYQLSYVNADHVDVVGNQISQSSSSVSTTGGIDCNSRYTLIESNDLSFPSATYGIDCGGAIEPTIRNNNVNMGSRGAAVDVGGAQNAQVISNHLYATGAVAVLIYDLETDGSGVPFPYHASNITIQNNDIILSGAGALGVQLYDDAGATSGTQPINVLGNRFVGVSSAGSSQDINYFSSGSGITVSGNTHNGAATTAIVLNGNTDYVFDTVYDAISGDTTAGAVRSFVNGYVNSYNSGTKILYVIPSAGGSGYTSATTLSAGGGCTWTGTPLISAGSIIGVRTSSTGAGCSGATVITATDSGGGSGATFTVSVTPALPSRKSLLYKSAATTGNIVALSGGFLGIGGTPSPILVQSGAILNLIANSGGSGWNVATGLPDASIAVGSLPTCNATYNGVKVSVTGSTTSKWQARCNGTNWLWPDGTTVSG